MPMTRASGGFTLAELAVALVMAASTGWLG